MTTRTKKRVASTPLDVNEFSGSNMGTNPKDVDSTDPVDIKEYPGKYMYIVDIPGLRNNEIKVQIEENNVLVICGDRKKFREVKNEGVKYVRMGRKITNINLKFRLPFDANPHAVSAYTDCGVLAVTVKKFVHIDPKKPKIVAVESDFMGKRNIR